MYVGVIHRISDPEAFEAAEQRALGAGLPEGISLPIHAATLDHTTGMCIWEGESVEAVRELVESVVGEHSENEYFELEVDGLPAREGCSPRSGVLRSPGSMEGPGRCAPVPLLAPIHRGAWEGHSRNFA